MQVMQKREEYRLKFLPFFKGRCERSDAEGSEGLKNHDSLKLMTNVLWAKINFPQISRIFADE